MPLYEYECEKCHKRTEKIEGVNGPHLKKCPHCGGKVEQLVSAPAIQFKGSGWYVTDYAGKKSAGAESSTSGKSDTKDSGKDGGAESSSSSKDSGSKESSAKESSSKESSSKDSGGKESSSKESKGKSSAKKN